MRTHSVLRTILLCSLPCLASLLLSPGPAGAEETTGTKPAQFTSGQNGTPNLPVAPSMVIDKNNMLAAYDVNADVSASDYEARGAFLRSFNAQAQQVQADLAQNPVPEKKVQDDFGELRRITGTERKRVADSTGKRIPLDHSLYVGAEVRAGADKPVYSPELTYGDTRSGLELGVAGYSQGAFVNGASRRDSLGVSLKYIVGSLAARSLEHYGGVREARAAIEAVKPTAEELEKIVNRPARSTEEIRARIEEIGRAFQPRANALAVTPRVNIETVLGLLKREFSDLEYKNNLVLEEFVKGARRPALAFVVGDQSYRGGDIFSGGAVASRLYRFGEGAPGVTAVAVAQYFHDSFREVGYRSAGRLGLAAIYQDTTLTLITLPPDASGNKVETLGPPWHYKIGLEYTTPLLGLHETGAVFARYRWTPSYVEVTTTYGKDGRRRDYLDISLGKSFTF